MSFLSQSFQAQTNTATKKWSQVFPTLLSHRRLTYLLAILVGKVVNPDYIHPYLTELKTEWGEENVS